MITSREVREIEARIAGDEGGGDAPQPFFDPILDHLYDTGSVTAAEASKLAKVSSARARIERNWRKHGGFPGFIQNLLDIIEYRGLAKANGYGIWHRMESMKEGETVMLLSALKGNPKSKVSYTVLSAEERQRRNEESKSEGEFNSVLALLNPNETGVRKLDPANVDTIEESVRKYGLQDHSPILIDNRNGRILAGRHRLAVAERLDIKWPERRLKGLDDLQALGIVMSSNIGRPWSRVDYERLDKLIEGNKTARLRQKITLALLEDASRSDNELGELTDSCGETVAKTRASLLAEGRIGDFKRARGGQQKPGLTEKITNELLKDANRSDRELGKICGCAHHKVAEVRTLMGISSENRNRIPPPKPQKPIPENIRQALIDNPTLNHTTIAQMTGESARTIGKCCKQLIAEGVYNECQHHTKKDGKPVPAGTGRKSESSQYDVHVFPVDEQLERAEAMIRHLEAELARETAARERAEAALAECRASKGGG